MNIRNNNKNYFNYGLFGTFIVIAVIIRCIAVNYIFSQMLPSSFVKFDTTKQKIFTISDTTKEAISNVNKDVTINYINTAGEESLDTVDFLKRFSDLNSHIKYNLLDVSLHPTYTSPSGTVYESSDLVSGNILITGDKEDVMLSSTDITTSKYTEEELQYYYYNNGALPEDYQDTIFNGETKIASAILRVSSDNLPKIYFVTGHGESDVQQGLSDSFSDDNILFDSLSLLTQSIPDDAAGIVLNAPLSDINDEEYSIMDKYLKDGGNLYVFAGVNTDDKMSNLNKLLSENFGVSVDFESIIIENNENMYYQYPYYLLPETKIQDIDGNRYRFVPIASPIIISEEKTADITVVLSTSSDSYLTSVYNTELTPDGGDDTTSGNIPVSIYTDNGSSKLFLVSSNNFALENADSVANGGNTELLMHYINLMAKDNSSVSLATESKIMNNTSILVPNVTRILIFSILVIAVPVISVIIGIYIWVVRRKRKQ